MPERKRDLEAQGGSSFPPIPGSPVMVPWAEALAAAWDRLLVANDALAAVNDAGNREWSRTGMRLVRDRALAFVAAMDQALAETES